MEMDEIIEAFLQESDELLTSMEDCLLSLENDPKNPESLNAIFRAVHTIKGSSGMFGFDWIVEFSHVLENLLENMRSGLLTADSTIIEELLISKDYLLDIIRMQADKNHITDNKVAEGKVLLDKLLPYLKKLGEKSFPVENTNPTPSSSGDSEKDNHPSPTTGDRFRTECYHISLRLNENVFINALDPMSFIKYLKTLGKIEYLKTMVTQVPDWEEWNPENCYLGFEIRFRSDKPLEEVKKVFEFLEYDSQVSILEPGFSAKEIINHIQALPEDEILMGNIFQEMGTTTQAELVQLLEIFHRLNADSSEQDIEEAVSKVRMKESSFPPTTTKDKTTDTSNQKFHSTLRVDSSRVDHLISKVGELVVSEANLTQLIQDNEDSVITESLYSVSRLIHEIREISLKLRMVPIGENFNKYHRIVRDLGNELSKKVKLHITGADTELDKTVMERLADPMVHIVRNAIDHGLETPEEREKNGKEPEGNLYLNAYHETGSIIIEISDDGKGINHDRVMEKAIEKGILPEGSNPSKEEIERLLFHPGFSTADQISNISGRGVGLDVVQKNIEGLRGFIQVQSEKNRGTKFIIRLPLTLAIIDGFLVGSGKDLYVVPLDMVRECVEFKDELKTGERTGQFFNLRGSILPYIRLDEFFHGENNASSRENIVVTEFQGKKFGLVVDRLFGEFQTVIKPLAKVFRNIRGLGGSTTLGDGKIALILDIADLHFFLQAKQDEKKND